MDTPGYGNPVGLPRVPLTCAVCGGDTAGDGGGVLTMSVRRTETGLECHQIRYHRACVPADDRQVHAAHQELVDRALAGRGAAGAARTPEPPRAARTPRPPRVDLVAQTTGDRVTLVAKVQSGADAGTGYRVLDPALPYKRGFETVVFTALMQAHNEGPVTLQVLTERLLASGEYARVAPKAAASKDPTKPVSVVLEQWVATGKVVRS